MAARLHRTSTAGSQTTWTFSGWFKRSNIGSSGQTINSATDGNNWTQCYFGSDDTFKFKNYVSSSTTGSLETNRKFRDPAAWYHIVLNWDTTNASAGDRMRIYVNGVEETSFSSDVNPGSSVASNMNTASSVTALGGTSLGSEDFGGVMAHCHFIDGTIYAPTAFAETDATSGIWIAKTSPSVTYGTNGWFLKFASGAITTDSSGEGNTMTQVGTITNTKDTPDNNFCTLNPLDGNIINSGGLLNGGTTYNKTSTGVGHNSTTLSTQGVATGKWYWEVKATDASDGILGFINSNHGAFHSTDNQLFGVDDNSYGWRVNGTKYVGTSQTASFFNTYTDDDILSFAIDLDNGKCYAAKNGTWENSGDPTSGATGTGSFADISDTTLFYSPSVGNMNYNSTTKFEANYGNGYFGTTSHGETNADDAGIGLFKYDVPAGYYAICTTNLGDKS